MRLSLLVCTSQEHSLSLNPQATAIHHKWTRPLGRVNENGHAQRGHFKERPLASNDPEIQPLALATCCLRGQPLDHISHELPAPSHGLPFLLGVQAPNPRCMSPSTRGVPFSGSAFSPTCPPSPANISRPAEAWGLLPCTPNSPLQSFSPNKRTVFPQR